MKDYDKHGEAYRRWHQSQSPYWVIEQTRFFEVLGSVRNLNILELACGDGRLSRMLIERGAASVVATDISGKMIERAITQNRTAEGKPVDASLTFRVVDATDDEFQLDSKVDRVVAMYLFHYAPSLTSLRQMANLISRNLKPGGRFVAYTINPNYDLSRQDARLADQFGFVYRPIQPPHYELRFGQDAVNIWQWSEDEHREALAGAGLIDIEWHSLCLPAGYSSPGPSVQWYLDDPSCIVLSAVKANA